MKAIVLAWGMAATLGWAGTAAAEGGDGSAASPPSPAPAPVPSSPQPDIVRLKSGGLVRGTISEMDPAGSVIITTKSGKEREFPMTEVAYAGPAKDEPEHKPDAAEAPAKETETKPYVTVQGETAHVQLRSTEGPLIFYRQSGAATASAGNGLGGDVTVSAVGFSRLCAAPCQIELPAGTEQLSVSPEGRDPAKAESVTIPAGRSLILGSYHDNKPTRVAGTAVMVLGGIGGGLLLATGALSGGESGELDVGMMVAGAAVMGGGLVLGLVLASQTDKASFNVQPASDKAARTTHQRDGLPKPMMLRWSTAL